MSRIAIIKSGSDWSNATYHHLEIPGDWKLKELYYEWEKSIEHRSYGDMLESEGMLHIDFLYWLIKRGAKEVDVLSFTVV